MPLSNAPLSLQSIALRWARAFAKNERGNVATLFALAIIPIIGLVGAAVDYSRANNARTAMQTALDSTSLILSKDPTILNNASQLQTRAQQIFNSIYTNHSEATTPSVTAAYTANSELGSTIQVSASSSVPTSFMKVMGFSNLPISTTATAAWGNTRMRIALALDNTGSMDSDGKMDALKTAAKNLIDQLKASAKTDGDVMISIVPFSKDVDVQAGNHAASWLDWTDWEAEPANLDTAKGGSKPSDWSQIGPGSSCPFTSSSHGFTCMNRPATISNASSANSIPSSGTYAGMICPSIDNGNVRVAKRSVYYNGCYNSEQKTQTVDSGRNASCGSTQNCSCSGSGNSRICTRTYYDHVWRKTGTVAATARTTWNGCVFDRDQNHDVTVAAPTTAATKYSPEQYSLCTSELTPMSYDWTALKAKIDAMTPVGSTNQPIGLVWAWQTLMQNAPFAAPAEASGFTYKKIIIHLSDGMNTQNRWYGNGSNWSSQVDDRQALLCQNIKAANITMYMIQVNTGGDPKQTVMENCASGSDKFFMLTTANQVIATFNAIGASLTRLRIAR